MNATEYWQDFQKKHPEVSHLAEPISYYYGDNKTVADECAELVVKNIKKATTSSLWWFQKYNEPLPNVGDLAIVTDWAGEAKAIVKTTKVKIVKFKDVGPEYALTEGEGDKSLTYWKKAHWEYYANEMRPFGELPDEDMELVCEYFETL